MDDVFTSIVYIPVSATWKALSGLPSVSNFMYKSYSPPEVIYGAQNEAYMSRSAEKWVRALCFNELGVCG